MAAFRSCREWLGRRQRRAFYGILILVLLGAQLWRWKLATGRWICVDEFEHVHASWCLGQGMVPYRDFFEHHSPLLYLVLGPILRALQPEASLEAAIRAILVCRWMIWVLGSVILWLIYKLGREMHSRAAGAMAGAFTLSTMMFVDRSTEIRPDMLSVPAMLGAMLLTMRAMRGGTKGALRGMVAAGVVAGLGVAASPKSVFWLLGFGAAGLWVLIDGGQRLSRWQRVKIAAGFLVGAAGPMATMLAAAGILGAGREFVMYNFVLNSQWKFRLDPWEKIGELAYENPELAALGVVGSIGTLLVGLRTRGRRRFQVIPAAALLSLIAGIFVIPVPYTEYFMMPIPLLAIYEAGVIVDASGLVRRGLARRRWGARMVVSAIIVVAAAAALAWVLHHYDPPVIVGRCELWAWIAAGIVFVAASAMRWRYLGILLVLGMMTLFPLRRFVKLFDLSNERNSQTMAFVYENVPPHETVFDGWKGITAPFRPHAWYYFFLHREIRLMVPAQEWVQLRRDLEDGRIRPKLVVMDEDTRALPAPIVDYFKEHYEPSGVGEIWVRRENLPN